MTTRAPQARAVTGDGLGNLQRELAGGGEHHAERGVAAAALGADLGEALQHGQRERRRLAGACGGLADQVAALDQRRDRLGLYGAGLGVAQLRHHREQLGAQREVGKGGQVELSGSHVVLSSQLVARGDAPRAVSPQGPLHDFCLADAVSGGSQRTTGHL